jgi:hypothetical protein
MIGIDFKGTSENAGNRRLVLEPLPREKSAECHEVSFGSSIGVEFTVGNDADYKSGLTSTGSCWVALGIMSHWLFSLG